MNCIRLILTALAIQLAAGCASLDTASRSSTTNADEQYADIADLSTHTPPSSGGPSANKTAPADTRNGTFWGELRRGFRLTGSKQAAVVKQATDYGRNPQQIERVFKRGEPYLAYIFEEVKKRNFPTEIVLLPFVESGYDPFAYSHGRAAGMWQFIPGTGKMYGLKQDWWYDGRRDIVDSTRAALDYLEYLEEINDGNWLNAIASYNSGEGNVLRATRNNRKAGKQIDFWYLKPPKETSMYVPKLLALVEIVKAFHRASAR